MATINSNPETPKFNDEHRLLYESRNTDDVFIRNIVAGLLNVFNNQLTYTQTWDHDDVQTVNVPFFYNLGTSDERIIQDNFMFFQNVCDWPQKIDGNYDSFPRGYITLNSSSIEANSVCNRFVLGEYTKKEGDTFNTYVAFLYALPMRLEFTADILCDQHITVLKLDQALRETFYKNKTFFVVYKGMKLRCRLGLNDSNTMTAPVEYKMASDKGEASKPKLTFSFTVSSYHPVFDKSTEVRADSYIKEIAYDVSFLDDSDKKTIGLRDNDNVPYQAMNYYGNSGSTNNLHFTPETKSLAGSILSSDQTITLDWEWFKPDGDMRSIIINALDSETGEMTLLKNIKNQTYCDLKLSDFFDSDLQSNFKIDFVPTPDVITYTAPKIAVIPDIESKNITSSSFKVVDPGYFLDPRDFQLDFIFHYKDKAYDGKLNIKDGVVFKHAPVNFEHKIKFTNKLDVKNIAITLCDAEEPESNDDIANITIC